MKKNISAEVAKIVKSTLDTVLKTEANTASSFFVYEAKAPKKLKKYK